MPPEIFKKKLKCLERKETNTLLLLWIRHRHGNHLHVVGVYDVFNHRASIITCKPAYKKYGKTLILLAFCSLIRTFAPRL